jgi:hypothetical protein
LYTLTIEPRFRPPSLADEIAPPWAVQRDAVRAALVPLWDAVAEVAAVADRLDRWAGAHERRADAGEARDDAAADIETLTPQVVAALQLLQAIEAEAMGRPA